VLSDRGAHRIDTIEHEGEQALHTDVPRLDFLVEPNGARRQQDCAVTRDRVDREMATAIKSLPPMSLTSPANSRMRRYISGDTSPRTAASDEPSPTAESRSINTAWTPCSASVRANARLLRP